MVPKNSPHIIINAVHTVGGGGLTYLQGLLPELAQDEHHTYTLWAPATTLEQLNIPANIATKAVGLPQNFLLKHLSEQFILPCRLHATKCCAVLCNANYVPLLAPNPIPIVHNDPTSQHQKLYWALLKLLTRLSVLRAKAALSVSQSIISHYANGKTAQKIIVAPPGLPPLPWQGTPPAKEPHKIVAVGDIYPQKQYPLLLQGLAKLLEHYPNAHLHLIGAPLHAATTKELNTLIDQHNLSHHVTLQGSLPHAETIHHIATAQVLVNTSAAESVCLPVLEALQCGTPVVTNDLPAIAEQAGAAAVYVNLSKGGDLPAALAIALLGVLSNPSIGEQLAKQGHQRVQNRTWAATATAVQQALTLARV